MANLLKTLSQHVKNVPRFRLPDNYSLLPAWISSKGVAGRLDRRAEKMDSTPSDSKTSDHNREEKVAKSYLAAAVESISPWSTARSSTPKPKTENLPGEGSGLKNQHGGDHSTTCWRGLSGKRYPPDCPPLTARWFYAVDVSISYRYAYCTCVLIFNSDSQEETKAVEQ